MAIRGSTNDRESSGMDVPDYAIERMARCLLPMIQKYYESEEGQKELKEWEQSQRGKSEAD